MGKHAVSQIRHNTGAGYTSVVRSAIGEVTAPFGIVTKVGGRSAESADISSKELEHSIDLLLSSVHDNAGLRSADWIAALVRQVAEVVQTRQPVGLGLTQDEATYLVKSGALTPEQFAETETRVASGALAEQEFLTRQGAITRTLTTDEVAEKLGISSSRVRHRLGKDNLFAILVGRTRLYPTWQFIDDGSKVLVLPHLAAVVSEFPEGWQPASIEGFMRTPQESLAGDNGTWLTPVEWLSIGRDPEPIVAMLQAIAER